MKLGIMQPYFFPYIGYWQLMKAVDKYIIYDDVNYIKGGWINRNRILLNGRPHYINVPLLGASSNKKINEINVNYDIRIIRKSLKLIEAAYKKAPYYKDVYPVVASIMEYQEKNLAKYLGNSINILCAYLGITTTLVYSSTITKNCSLRGEEKVLEICKILGATEYYNAVGGQGLYSQDNFGENGIALRFIKTNEITYSQLNNKFEKNLSIIDVLMFNSKRKVTQMLQEYSLL